jgi:SAM-dependent methyltransferase
MRAGLENRRLWGLWEGHAATSARVPAAAGSVADGLSRFQPDALRQHGGLLERPIAVRAGPVGHLLRRVRALVRVLIRPWLHQQTRFNEDAVDQLTAIRAVLTQQIELNQAVVAEIERGSAERRLLKEAISRGRQAEGPPGHGVGEPPTEVAINRRIVEGTFVHTRLPTPPARVLDVGSAESLNPLEMASLGYQVVRVDPRVSPLRHPNLRLVRGHIAGLGFTQASFDVVVCLSPIEHAGLPWDGPGPDGAADETVIAEVHRVLRWGGRFILTVPLGPITAATPGHRIHDLASLDTLLAPFGRVEILVGTRDGEGWTVTAGRAPAAPVDPGDRVDAVALIVAEKT